MTLFHTMLAMLVILVTARAFGALLARVGQPPVIGEMLAGIVLGPSVLGRAAPAVAAIMWTPSCLMVLNAAAQAGVVLFMLSVGVEFDVAHVRQRSGAVALISQMSVAVPLVSGAGLGAYLYARGSASLAPRHVFVLFFAIAMSVTAFPVLVRILHANAMHRTELGLTAISCAALNDVSAWCLLAVVASLSNRSPSASVLLTFLLVVILVGFVRPRLNRWIESRGATPSLPGYALVLGGAGLLAVITSFIGVHAMFGAFVFGAILSPSPLTRSLTKTLDRPIEYIALPLFFASTGLQTDLAGAAAPGIALTTAIVVVASVGKAGGTFVAARLTGYSANHAMQLGVLMNTRGVVEFVVLAMGRERGILSAPLFSCLIVMAIVTTVATTPMLRLLRRTDARADIGYKSL